MTEDATSHHLSPQTIKAALMLTAKKVNEPVKHFISCDEYYTYSKQVARQLNQKAFRIDRHATK